MSSRVRPVASAVFVLLAAASSSMSRPQAAASGECLGCHGDATLAMQRKGRSVSLHVDGAAFGRSVHADLDCTDCHAGFKADEVPHAQSIRPVNCRSCHADIAESHKFHAVLARATGTGGAPGVSCKGCHGTHEIGSPKTPGTKFSRDNLASACAECHADVVRPYLDSAHGRAAAQKLNGAPDCLTCHDRPITKTRAGGETVARKIEQEKLCLSCHLDDPEVRARANPTAGFIAAYESSVHGKALLAGNAAAANCVDCHGAHEMKRGFEATARVNKMHIPGTCGACHREIQQEYEVSVHGIALRKGNADAPVCTNCHGEHTIMQHRDPRAPVAPANVSAQVCSPCHSSVRLSQKYGIRSDRFKSFSDSYHGLAMRGGQVEVANCASCHGAHGIRASGDPASSVYKANLATTCGKCHPGANARFAMGAVHVVMSQQEEPLLFWITVIYIVLIVGVVGGMAAHNGLDFARKARRRLQARRSGTAESAPVAHRLHLRMTRSERIQHAALFTSFILLVITGFMLHYPDAWWVVGLRILSDRLFDLRSLLHRVAGVVLLGASVFHLFYLGFTARGRRFLRDIWWTWSDLTDARNVLLYNLGLSGKKPLFGRFSYIEKSEYWALVWGNIVMGGTGLILWFENTFIGLITKLGWDVARTVHFYEAWLATLAIIVWHFYYVIFNPDVYPMNLAWITGTLSEEEMREEHPLELEALDKREVVGGSRPPRL
jgi:cytochrome b subunit of formate dehydrogenase